MFSIGAVSFLYYPISYFWCLIFRPDLISLVWWFSSDFLWTCLELFLIPLSVSLSWFLFFVFVLLCSVFCFVLFCAGEGWTWCYSHFLSTCNASLVVAWMGDESGACERWCGLDGVASCSCWWLVVWVVCLYVMAIPYSVHTLAFNQSIIGTDMQVTPPSYISFLTHSTFFVLFSVYGSIHVAQCTTFLFYDCRVVETFVFISHFITQPRSCRPPFLSFGRSCAGF